MGSRRLMPVPAAAKRQDSEDPDGVRLFSGLREIRPAIQGAPTACPSERAYEGVLKALAGASQAMNPRSG
jgi:hypothetical protein